MIEAILEIDSPENFRSVNQIKSWGYKIPSINADATSDTIRLPDIPSDGQINTCRVLCASEAYEISLRTADGIVTPSLKEILRVIEIDKHYDENELNLLYSNSSQPEESALYLIVVNSDLVNATGIIEFELIISRM